MAPLDPADEPTDIERAWSAHVSVDDTLLTRLIRRHRERQRRYHTIDHVSAVLHRIDELASTEHVDDLGAVVAAALYHDAIHEPLHPANERASARLARRDLTTLGWTPERIDKVSDMIEATASHDAAADTDTAVLLDADLAILGSEPERYARYASSVRAEYRHLDDGEWRSGRSDVLRSLLGRPTLYATATGRDRWESQARSNMAAELATLYPDHTR